MCIRDSGIRAVLDWELSHIGDPMRDLGWLCVNSWRFGNRSLPVGGFGRVEDLVSGYESVSGEKVDREALQFWEVFGSFWWSITTLGMVQTWRTGETPSVERPVIGRRSTEAQMDCVHLLIPGEVTALPNSDWDENLPSGSELINSVQTHLQENVAEKLAGADKFLIRVAINSLSIVDREISFRAEAERVEYEGLQSLLMNAESRESKGSTAGDDNERNHQSPESLTELRWKLVSMLRANLPLPIDILSDHLRQTVADRLYIDQPKYSALNGALDDGDLATQG